MVVALLLVVVLPRVQTSAAEALPELGDASSAIVSPEMERRIGEMFLKQVRASLPTVRDEILKYYVATQLMQLAQYSELREAVLSTVLIDSSQINAFAAPGGVVGINLGLMVHAEDVHEYASVVAHELAHLSQRHFARGVEAQQRGAIPMLVGFLVTAILAMTVGGDAGMAAMAGAQAAAMQNQLRYSRGREQEADRIGTQHPGPRGVRPARHGAHVPAHAAGLPFHGTASGVPPDAPHFRDPHCGCPQPGGALSHRGGAGLP